MIYHEEFESANDAKNATGLLFMVFIGVLCVICRKIYLDLMALRRLAPWRGLSCIDELANLYSNDIVN
jgi:hypothetical protein